MGQQFIKGMDVSSYPEMRDRGCRYFDYDGNEVDLLDFAKGQGFNYARLRLWNEPQRVPEAKGYCDLTHTREMAREVKRRGLGLLLDFHYSDFYADPGKQIKPAAWEGLKKGDLERAVYDFTRESLLALDGDGAYPDMVQIGNEIRCGMIWPDGKTDDWPTLAGLLNAGIRAVRDTQGDRGTQVVIHLDQGGRYYYQEEWFDSCISHGVTDFDIIGLSYYAFWHGGYADVKDSMERLAERYGRPIILAEVAHGYRTLEGGIYDKPQEELSGFPSSPRGQREVMELVMCITANITGGKGLGVFYWEPFCRPGGMDDQWAYSMSLVDENGRAMEGIRAFSEDPRETDPARIAKIYDPEKIKVSGKMAKNALERLPETARALRMDGSIERLPVSWDAPGELPAEGEAIIEGICNGQRVAARVEVLGDEKRANLALNGAFNDGLEGWEVEAPGCVDVQVREEVEESWPYGACRCLYVRGRDKFLFRISQKVAASPGRYRLSLSYKGDNTTGVKVEMYASCGGAKESHSIFPEEAWHEHAIEFDVPESAAGGDGGGADKNAAEIEIGIVMDSPISHGAVRDVVLAAI